MLIYTNYNCVISYHSLISGDSLYHNELVINVLHVLLLDCVRQMETHEKGRMHCIAVGPLADDGATRTYFISCSK